MNRLWMYRRRFFGLILCGLLGGLGAAQLQAQQSAVNMISGSVVDPDGAAVPNATVIVRNQSSGVELRSATDQEGKFSFANLPAGKYTVQVSAPGLALTSRQGIEAPREPHNTFGHR